MVGGTWLSSLGNGGNGHLDVYSRFQHARRMAHGLLLVLPCISRINLFCPFLPPSSWLLQLRIFSLSAVTWLTSWRQVALHPRIHHPVLLNFITGENDKLSPSSSPPAPTSRYPQSLRCAVLGDQGYRLQLFTCKTAPEHLCECDRGSRHDDRDGGPEPSAG